MSDPDGFDVCPLCGYNKHEEVISEFVEWIDYILNSYEGEIPRKELEAEKKILEKKTK